MLDNGISREMYFLLNKSLELQNAEFNALQKTKEYKYGSYLCRIVQCLKSGNWKSIRGFFRNLRWEKKLVVSNNSNTIRKDKREFVADDYFTNDRIAVYTCVFGKYDSLQEPVIKPDNIDYYIITDRPVPDSSLWKTVSWEHCCSDELSCVEKNRYFKMHPECIFPKYRYSIYIDGNIKVISDLSPYVKLLGQEGIGFHYHNQRQCAYEELEAIKLAYKARKEDADAYKTFLLKKKFPKNYGLLECNVIVREHDNPICRKIMDEWWKQFRDHIKRDQVSLPFVLFSNGIKVDSVAVLGKDVYSNYSFRIVKHKN